MNRSRNWLLVIFRLGMSAFKSDSESSRPRDTGTDLEFDPFLFLQELEALYTKASQDRTLTFQASRRRYEYDFVQAENARWMLEHARDDLFDAFLRDVRETFMESQESRMVTYKEMLAKHDDVNGRNEARRDGLFREAQARRESGSQSARENQERKVRDCIGRWLRMFEKGRERRELVYEMLFRSASEGFERVRSEAEDRFFKARGLRAKMVGDCLVRTWDIIPTL